MAEQLTTEQVLLLNNLMYMTNDEPLQSIDAVEAKTVGAYMNHIQTSQLREDADYGSYMTGEDWKNIIAAIKNDKQLMNMKIVETHVDSANGGGGGLSAVFADPSTNEAVVTFRGTASLEWKDNFIGGGPTDAEDGVSTPYQENALKWYRSLDLSMYDTVTVTGHSKGGNKAKYITVMDESVDRCLSFDGQGFSDEFMNQYQSQIVQNQGKITNSNVDSDYVNLLLNDIGKTDFYKGYDYGDGGFLENHCPNTFFNFESDGSFHMTESARDGRMAELDEFLNNYLRTLSWKEKQETLAMIGEMVEGGFNGASAEDMLGILLEGKNVDYAANLASYLLEYKKENPELVDALNDILSEMDMDDITKIVDTVVAITDWKYFDNMMDGIGWLSGHIPDFVYDLLQDYLKDKGITLSKEELEKLLGMLQTMADDMDEIKITDHGADMVVLSGGGNSVFIIYGKGVSQAENDLEDCGRLLEKYAERIRSVCGNLDRSLQGAKGAIAAIGEEVMREAQSCRTMRQVLEETYRCYESSEQKIAATAKV